MIHLLNVDEWAEKYQQQSLSPEELKKLHAILEEDAVLNNAFEQALQMQILLTEQQKRQRIRQQIAMVAAEHKAANASAAAPAHKSGILIRLQQYWRPTAAAAAIALCSSLLTYTFTTRETKSNKNQYVLLKRDIESIKKSQNQIINNMKQSEKREPAAPEARPGIYGGSGFAIGSNGYFATNYHVVEKADSIYLQMNNGKAYKASIIKVNTDADLAIVKIDDPSFSFKQAMPYTIDKKVAPLGQRIFSIGFPKDEVVYNEGYISSEKGYDGNANAYQLEITANPGQSGAPILDRNGNIVGIITGKQSNTSGTTFAVHAEQLLKMIAELPKEHKVNLSTKNKFSNQARPEQVKQLRDFVCAVKVY